jgi:L-2,4-diaminobutyric acid acetyltransferase
VVGELDGELVAAISGYLVPGREDTLFVWQVAVSEAARGRSLGRQMLNHLVARPACAAVTHLETTVTESNRGSWGMFESFASRLDAQIERRPLFERSVHFAGEHDTEILARIGPLPQFSDRSAPTVIDQHLEETKV